MIKLEKVVGYFNYRGLSVNDYSDIIMKKCAAQFIFWFGSFQTLFSFGVLCKIFIFCLIVFVADAQLLQAQVWHGKVVRVIDGDSLIVKKGDTSHEVRLYGIDAPEHGQDYSKVSARYVRKKWLGEKVSVEPMDIDKYGRIIAFVRNNGKLVNKEMVRVGLAWVYPWFCREKPICTEMKKEQAKARKNRLGLWKNVDFMPPWQWRRNNKR